MYVSVGMGSGGVACVRGYVLGRFTRSFRWVGDGHDCLIVLRPESDVLIANCRICIESDDHVDFARSIHALSQAYLIVSNLSCV